MNPIQKVFEALFPERAEEPLTDWEKGVLIVDNFSVKNVQQEDMLDALISLLLSTIPSSPDAFAAYQDRMSSLIDELVGERHLDEFDLESVRSWLTEGKDIQTIRHALAVAHNVPTPS